MSIKLENLVLASPEQMSFVIQGLRNPTNSHDRSDKMNELYHHGIKGQKWGKRNGPLIL